jgi:hypothetical protein
LNFATPLQPAKGRPAVIGKFRERLEEILERRPRKLLELHGGELLPEWQRRRLIPRRPGFRENFGKVIGVMLEHFDLLSRRVGAPRSDGNVTPPAQQGPDGREDDFGIAVESGCSIQQVRRVIRAAVHAGYLRGPRKGQDGKMLRGPDGRGYQRVEEYTDAVTGKRCYHAHRVVYVFTPLFFERLGLDMVKRLEREQAAASKRRAERRQRMHPGPLLAGRELARGMRHGSREERRQGAAGAPTRAIADAPAPRGPLGVDAAENASRLVALIMRGLRNKHPDWPAARLRAEAEALERSGRLF